MSRSKAPFSLISIAVTAAIAAPAFAADPSDPQVMRGVSVVAEVDSYNAPTAESSKTDTPLRDIPQSISVITRQSMDDLGMQNIGDAVTYVPGVGMAQGEGNRETPVIRGSSNTGDFFLDGMRDDVQYYRDLYNIEQVEVLKGANGMLFGRGGVSGLINRVTKQANGENIGRLTIQGGSNSNKRASLDIGSGLNDSAALRLNAMFEDSDSYRDDVYLKRHGVNPTMRLKAGESTTIDLGVEYFHDERTADRGVSAYLGVPLDTRAGEFFGNPELSPTDSTVKSANAFIEHRFGDVILRNRTRFADYDKFYQNVFPAAVNAGDPGTSTNPLNPPGLPAGSYAAGTIVQVQAYNQATQRENFFNQTELTLTFDAGSMQHKLLTGLELGRQKTSNFRETGYFNNADTTHWMLLTDPRTTTPITWRQAASDADNDSTANIIGLFLQDEIAFLPKWTLVAGLRLDRFKVDLTNNRNSTTFSSSDYLLSPRLALVHKPVESISLYASYGLAHQPRAGDQLASLSATNAALDPEKFTNYELGAKWDYLPELSVTAALFRVERDNIAIADPTIGQPGGAPAGSQILIKGQRNQGLELGVTGAVSDNWSIIGSFAYQDAKVTRNQTSTVLAGARLAAVPKAAFSLWNRYDFSETWGAGLGIIRKGAIFAATENLSPGATNVKLPGYTRVDGAAYFRITGNIRAQVNIENLLDKEYFQFAHSNTNITPGSPRAFRATITAWF